MQKITKKLLLEKAENLHLVKVKSLKKSDLIHRIQEAEGHNPCFKTIPNCAIDPCLFRQECMN